MSAQLASVGRRIASKCSGLPLLYSDRGLIVINKPTGLVTQKNKNALSEKGERSPYDSLLRNLKEEFKLDWEPVQVHRLDKNTTGVFLLAKSKIHARTIFQQFQSHSIKKSYLAIVRGGRKSFPEVALGFINEPLRVALDKVHVDERAGAPALTDWELLGSSEKVPLSLLRLSLHSGIKHQLRVHLASVLRTPILGDILYSRKLPPKAILDLIPKDISLIPRRRVPSSSDAKNASAPLHTESTGRDRVFLHAAHVDITRFSSEGSSKRLGITAPLPSDFLAVCEGAGLTQFLTPEYIQGGLNVDGETVPRREEIPGIEGRWLA